MKLRKITNRGAHILLLVFLYFKKKELWNIKLWCKGEKNGSASHLCLFQSIVSSISKCSLKSVVLSLLGYNGRSKLFVWSLMAVCWLASDHWLVWEFTLDSSWQVRYSLQLIFDSIPFWFICQCRALHRLGVAIYGLVGYIGEFFLTSMFTICFIYSMQFKVVLGRKRTQINIVLFQSLKSDKFLSHRKPFLKRYRGFKILQTAACKTINGPYIL